MKILIALSGGVDSSVAAHLLHEQGHQLIGVMFKLWTDPLAPPVAERIPTKCCSLEHIQRARSVCQKLGIPFYLINFEEEFKRQVVDPMLEDYRKGLTPNPCIECNRTIKFGTLFEKAAELGCEALATGHYARIETDASGDLSLLEATDRDKDQSYFLYRIDRAKLQNILFPLGSIKKSDVFIMASRYGVPIPESYHESQDLCFYPEKEPGAFLRRYLKDVPEGDIVTEDGTVVGRHQGLPFYTIGQRRGLKIGGLKIPLHVVNKNIDRNEIIVAPSGADLEYKILVKDVSWISGSPQNPSAVSVRVHSLGNKAPGRLETGADSYIFHLAEGMRGIAPGQSAVFYDGGRVLGGGIISVDE